MLAFQNNRRKSRKPFEVMNEMFISIVFVLKLSICIVVDLFNLY